MRYILNNEGYIYHVSFGAEISCSLGNCTEYVGEIPTGYSSIEDWYSRESEKLNSWKIVNGNLLYDSNRARELEAICSEQEKNNRHVTKQELDTAIANVGQAGSIEASNSEELSMLLPEKTATGKIIQLNDASSYEVPYIEIAKNSNVTNEITLVSSTSNLLPNEAITQTIGGLSITVRANKSIVITGQATDGGAITIAGSISNITPLFILKANTSYYLADLPTGMIWNLYYYNGVDKELVHSCTGGVINLTQDKPITQVDITWATADIITTENDEPLLTEAGEELSTEGGEVTSEAIIFPMLNVGNTPKEYEEHKSNRTVINLGNNEFTSNIEIKDGRCTIDNELLSIDRIINTYNPNTVIYAMEDVGLSINYLKCDFYNRVETAYLNGIGYNFTFLRLRNTYDSTGAIQKFSLSNFSESNFENENSIELKLRNGSNTQEANYEEEIHTIKFKDKLRTLNNVSDEFIIENGKAYVIRKIGVNSSNEMYVLDNEATEDLGNIYLRTWDGTTEIGVHSLIGTHVKMYVEYMLKSTFTDIFCTITEKNASVKVLEDMIKLEVKRASEAEGELSSSITIEADKISQIVSAVGDEEEEVTPASIVAAINDSRSSVKISADHIDIEGTTFPTIQSNDGQSNITALSSGGGITYSSFLHAFSGTLAVDLEKAEEFVVRYLISSGVTRNLITAGEDYIHIGQRDETTIVLNGNLVINGQDFDGTAKFG